MAAAWPYCDAVVSAHNFEALGDLLAALRAPRAHRPSFVPPSPAGTGANADADAVTGAAPAAGPAASSSALSLPITQNLGRRWSPWRS
jgi:hypothetical protein